MAAGLHFSEGQEFLELAARVQPWWFLLAVMLQIATYIAQGEIFRGAPRASGSHLPLTILYELSLAKLFMDQALPSAGVSSSVLIAKALERHRVSRAAVAASILINIASYHAAYVLCLLVALVITTWRGQTNVPVLILSLAFMAFCVGVTVAALLAPGPVLDRLMARGRRVRALKHVLEFVTDADPDLTRSPRLLGEAIAWQILIFVLDAATIWVFVRSLGAVTSVWTAFASFMISSLFRTVGIVPGGLGTFEATSVWTLHLMGVSVPVALASTLLFRGVSFWLPMVPGLWVSRRTTTGTAHAHAR
jgi:Mg2+-importing ATPase